MLGKRGIERYFINALLIYATATATSVYKKNWERENCIHLRNVFAPG